METNKNESGACYLAISNYYEESEYDINFSCRLNLFTKKIVLGPLRKLRCKYLSLDETTTSFLPDKGGSDCQVFLPNFTTKHTGSGIGLALAKRGIEHANGSIWFETVEGIGTSFFVEMPLVIVHKL